jgi:PAS domain S-box-containing protein
MDTNRGHPGALPVLYLAGMLVLAGGLATALVLSPLTAAIKQRDLLVLAGVVAYSAVVAARHLSRRRIPVTFSRVLDLGTLGLIALCDFVLRPAAPSVWLFYPLSITFIAFASEPWAIWPAVGLAIVLDSVITAILAGHGTPFTWVDLLLRSLTNATAGFAMTRGVQIAARFWRDALDAERKYSGDLLRLASLGQPLANALTFDQLRDRLPSLLQRAVPQADAGVVFLLESSRKQLVPFASFGLGDTGSLPSFATSGNLVAAAVQSREPALHTGPELETALANDAINPLIARRQSPAESKPVAAILAPIKVSQAARGALLLLADAPDRLTARENETTRTIASNLGTVLEHLDFSDLLRRVAQQRETLLKIAHGVASATDLEQIYQALHEGTRELMPCDSFVVALFDEDATQARLVYVIDDDKRSAPITVAAKAGLLGHMLAERQGFRLDDLLAPLPFSPRHYGGERQVRSAVCAPLRVGDRLIGMISAQTLRAGAYFDEDLRLLTAMAESAGANLEHMRHLERERHRAHNFEGLAHNLVHLITRGPLAGSEDHRSFLLAQVTRMMGEYLNAGFCLTLMLNEDGQNFQVEAATSLQPVEDLAPPGTVVALTSLPRLTEIAQRGSYAVWRRGPQGDPEHQAELHLLMPQPPESVAILPIGSPSQHWGVLLAGKDSPWDEMPFQPEQLRLADMIVRQIGVSLENQAANEASSQRLNSLTRLYELELSLSAADDPMRVLELTLDVAIEALWANAGGIALWQPDQQVLRTVISRNVPAPLEHEPFRSDGLGMTTFRGGQARYFSNLRLEANLHPMVGQSGIRAAAHLPLRTDGAPFGLLLLDFFHPRDFPEQDRRLLEMFAARAALAYEKARLLRALQEAHERFERTVQHVPGAIYRDSIDGGTTFISQGIRDLTGYSPEEWIGTPSIWREHLHPDDRERVQASFDAAIAQGKEWIEEYRLRDKQDRWRWIRDVARMVREPDGSIHFYDGVMTDITTRRQLEERLLRTARLESATALGMGLAHEINNALSTLSLHSYLLSRRMPAGNEDVAHHLQIIEQTVQRTAGLIQHFRELAQPTPTALAPVSISALLEEIVATFGERLREQGVTLDLMLTDDLPRIHGDRTGLYEAFSAIVKNAIEALPAGGLLTIRSQRATMRHDGSDAPGISVLVRDTGAGILEQDLPRVFEPGFTRKVEGGVVRGLGFGLAIAQQIIGAHGGEIEVQSEPGTGTTVRVALPTETES